MYPQSDVPAPAANDQGPRDAAPNATVCFADLTVNATLNLPNDHAKTFLWLKTCADSARNLVNGKDAQIQARAQVLVSGKGIAFGELELNSTFYLPTDTRRAQPWTKVSATSVRNPANGSIRRMKETFLVLP
jgi:hypothetical protein